MFDDLKGRFFGSETIAKKSADGYWTIKVDVIERQTEDGENWREERITASAMDFDFQTAHQAALMSVMQEMEALVYSKGLDSLIQGIDKRNKELEASHGAEAKVDTSLPA